MRGMELEHPLFEGFGKMDMQGLEMVRDYIRGLSKRQFTEALTDTVLFEVKVAKDASLGQRELRIETNRGLSNPLRFQVSRVIELREKEPNGNIIVEVHFTQPPKANQKKKPTPQMMGVLPAIPYRISAFPN